MFLPLHDRNPIKHIKFPYVTYGLIGLNLVVFLIQSVQSDGAFNATAASLGVIPVELFGIYPGNGVPEWWTLVTYQFLHGGGLHMLSNMLFLWIFGDNIEDALGHVKFVIFYLVCGIYPGNGVPEWWTLVTYQFLHGSWLHVLSNMLFLWIFGDNIEDALGHVKFVIFYLVCGAGAAFAHALFNAGSFGPLVGASGAVSGLMGAYILLYPHARVYVLFRIVIPIPLPLPAMWMLAGWFAVQLFNLVIAPDAPVAWWAHIGGMAVGAALVVTLRRREIELFGGR